MRKWMIPLGILVLIGLDQASKFWIVEHIALGEVKAFWPNVFSLTYLQNHGAAFSMLQHQQWLFTVITLVVMGAASYQLIKHYKASWLTVGALSLVIAGGLGNFIDRLWRGYVVDMIHLDFMDFAIFNVADSFLTVGVILLVLSLWKDEEVWK